MTEKPKLVSIEGRVQQNKSESREMLRAHLREVLDAMIDNFSDDLGGISLVAYDTTGEVTVGDVLDVGSKIPTRCLSYLIFDHLKTTIAAEQELIDGGA